MRILLPLVQFASVSLAQNDCAQNFSQCNGQHWPYSVCCIDPAFTCQVVTPYLSLCVPKPAPVVEIGPWGQCGGLAWGGPTACSNEWQCRVVNPYYSQCIPPYPTQPPATPGTPAPTGITATPATTNASSDIDCYDDVQDETGVLSPDDVANTSNITLAPGAIVAAYGQCGGYTYVGSNICVQGYYCQAANDWYSQCVPIPNLPGLPTYSQCGGNLWTGPTDCQAGTTCTEVNAWYSQCLPF